MLWGFGNPSSSSLPLLRLFLPGSPLPVHRPAPSPLRGSVTVCHHGEEALAVPRRGRSDIHGVDTPFDGGGPVAVAADLA